MELAVTIICFIIAVITCISLVIMIIQSTEDEKEAFAEGFLFLVAIIFALASGFEIFSEEPNYDGFKHKTSEASEIKIDTTFTTRNGITDTTYVVYYNRIKE